MTLPPLTSFTKAILKEYLFPGTDAAVFFLPDHQEPSPEIKDVLKRSSQQRFYPVPGGEQVKFPWHFVKNDGAFFERETNGWDHEHCDFCGGHIEIGQMAWTAEAGRGYWLFCGDCHGKLEAE